MAEFFTKSIHRLTYFFCIVSSLTLLVMMLLTTGDVISRNIFNWPISGTFELSQYMLAVVVLLSIAYAQQERQHVRVDLLVSQMNLIRRTIIDIFFTIVALGFFVLLAWQGVSESMFAMQVGKSSDILHIPAYPFEMLVAVGAFLICLELLLDLVADIKLLKSGTSGNEAAE